jgi:capsular exopolysaccharide synthesis family protein
MKVAIDLHPSQHSTKVVAFVSALPGEGKTTVAGNFAASLARGNARTLLIDADLRNPSLTKLLGYQNAPGLVNLVSEQLNIEDVVVKDKKFRFDFLPASARIKPPNSSDILTSKNMKALLDACRKQYQYVIVDMPPILPVVDVKASANMFDGFIQVVEWGKTSIDEVGKAVSASPILSERLLGVVLNKTDETAMRRFEGYTSERTYSYYSDERQIESTTV